MVSLLLNLGLFLPLTFSVEGFARAQEVKVNTFLNIVLSTTSAGKLKASFKGIKSCFQGFGSGMQYFSEYFI